MPLHKINVLRVIARNDHVIDIEKKKGATTRGGVDKESRIVFTGRKTSIDDNKGEMLKPGPRSLLKAIERTAQPTNQAIRNRVSWRWLHIDFLS
jgi:hypothetical protein